MEMLIIVKLRRQKKINNIENNLNKLKESKKTKKLKNYVKKLKNSLYGKDKDKTRTEQARSFEDQKGKGYVDLSTLLSKIYTNNSSRKLTNDIKK